MNAPIPGAWLRAGISRDGGPLHETRHVVWVQSGEFYADSRGFAGTTVYDGRQVTFRHEVGSPGHDVGTLRREGSDLIETGENPDGSTFMEVWTPLDDTDDGTDDDGADGTGTGEGAPEGSWRAGGTQTVRMGRHVVHVDSAGNGAHFVLPDGRP